MNIIKREWSYYKRQTIYWCMGIVFLLGITFFKVKGLALAQGGIDALMKSMPAILQVFFGDTTGLDTGIAVYRMIHLYLSITLALHAIILGAHIFAKEEHDKTFEFLYVKGRKRSNILLDKTVAGIGLFMLLDVVCILATYVFIPMIGYTISIMELVPYIVALFIMQMFFFTFALLISLWMRNNHKAGMIGCCVIFVMFMISMYAKMGGDINLLDTCSIFHYIDSAYIQTHTTYLIPMVWIMGMASIFLIVSQLLHNRRDFL